jgi:lysozyme family protein
VELVLSHEGGYSQDPDDAGGETNFGISKRSYPLVDVARLTRAQAIDIYFRDWWEKYGYESIGNFEIAASVFDFAINAGQSTSVKRLQIALNLWNHSLELDGVLGPKTIRATNSATTFEHEPLLMAFSHFRAVYYESLAKPKYIKGWLRRSFS